MAFKNAVYWSISRQYRFKFYPRFGKFHVNVLWGKIKGSQHPLYKFFLMANTLPNKVT